MKPLPPVGEIRFSAASGSEFRSGLLAYARVEVGPFRVDGITVRRTRGGRLAVAYPSRRDGDGRKHTMFLPTDRSAREALERLIIAAYRSHGGERP